MNIDWKIAWVDTSNNDSVIKSILNTINVQDSGFSNDSYERAYEKSVVEAENVKDAMAKGAIRYIHHATCIAIVLSYLFGAGLITLAVLWIWLSFQPIFWPFSTVEASENAKKFITEIENFFSMVVPPIIAFIVGYISKPNKKCQE